MVTQSRREVNASEEDLIKVDAVEFVIAIGDFAFGGVMRAHCASVKCMCSVTRSSNRPATLAQVATSVNKP